jgi:nucleosome binding factor SPN SPT16 subunit
MVKNHSGFSLTKYNEVSSQKQQKNYEQLLEIVEKVYTTMTENTKLSTVYNKCVELVKEKRPDWLDNFPKNIGFGMLNRAKLFVAVSCAIT